jgi:chaperonin GroES
MSLNLKPLGDRVVIQPKKADEKTKSGLYLPSTASKDKPIEGTVVAVGVGKNNEQGQKVPMEVKVGDNVIYSEYAGTEIKVHDEKYLIVREDDILAIN